MAIIVIAIWFLIYGILALVSTEIPKWIVPFSAILVGLFLLATSWRSAPKAP